MKTLIFIGFISLVVLTGCTPVEKPDTTESSAPDPISGDLQISGADAMFPLLKALAGEYMKLHPNLNIAVEKGGTGLGLQKLLNGEVDLAMVSRELTSDEESLGFWFFPVAKEGVVPVVSAKNPYLEQIHEKGVKRNILKDIYKGETELTWGKVLDMESWELVLHLTRADASGAAAVWANYLNIPRNELTGWGVDGDDGMIQKIKDEPNSLGYCNAHYAYDFMNQTSREGIEIIPLDINNNGKIDPNEKFSETTCLPDRAGYMGKYPLHLCREIALVSLGKPVNGNAIEFLRWVYGPGQTITKQNGYAELRNCIAEDYLKLLNQTIFK